MAAANEAAAKAGGGGQGQGGGGAGGAAADAAPAGRIAAINKQKHDYEMEKRLQRQQAARQWTDGGSELERALEAKALMAATALRADTGTDTDTAAAAAAAAGGGGPTGAQGLGQEQRRRLDAEQARSQRERAAQAHAAPAKELWTPMARNATAALAKVAADLSARAPMVHAGVLPALVRVLGQGPAADRPMLSAAVECMAALCQEAAGAHAALNAGCCRPLLSMSKIPDKQVERSCC